jgi:hypothetical protein
MEEYVQVTQTELTAAFTEWDRRYRETPEEFTSSTAETYGEECAIYLLSILKEQGVK